MILACPACATCYRVVEQEFEGSTGRTVRCANCGHLWYEPAPMRQIPDGGEPLTNRTADRDAAIDEAAAKVAAPIPPLGIPPSRPQSAPRRRFRTTGIASIVVLLAAVVIAGIFVRHHFAADQPRAAALHTANQQPAAASQPGRGLVIGKIMPTRTAEGLVVDGEIANPGSAPRDIPRLRVVLQDSSDKAVQSKTVDPPKPRLEPGETVHFATSFTHPPDAATGVVVTFAPS
jgi:predicted Zn finger-like uncharacterized protein